MKKTDLPESTGNSIEVTDLIQIGIALSSEKNINVLLDKIASVARRVTRAEGVTVYTCSEDNKLLNFAVVQNEKLDLRCSGESVSNMWSGIELYHRDGSRNKNNVSAHCALTGEVINISDVYNEEGFDFSGTRIFDEKSQYRSQSMLLIPMRDNEDDVIGVLQLLNCKAEDGTSIIEFPETLIELVTGLASQAAIAITNVKLVNQTENLLKSFVKAIAFAIDEKSHYTAGHISRVVQITENIARAINESTISYFKDVHFSEYELEEIRLAAWLHDIGKIATPQFIVDKATKLETIVDRIELIRLRLELLRRDVKLGNLLRGNIDKEESEQPDSVPVMPKIQNEVLESIDAFLREINVGSEYLHDDDILRVKEIAELSVNIHGTETPLLKADELDCCIIQKGTLTEQERNVINRHVVTTIEMLTKLPFPKKWQKVPEIAGMHHEKLDGSGYPLGLKAEDIPLPARILAVADIFEALTAADRPYKTGKHLSEAVKIMEYMVKDKQLDEDICNILLEEGIALAYARMNMTLKRVDSYTWRGKTYDIF